MTKKSVDPITVSTIWHSMQTSCMEMRHTMIRTAQNYLMGQLHDLSVGIWDAAGRTVAVPVGLPVQFLGTGFAVRAILEKFKDDLHPGDVILTNDPYHGGHNCHLPDWGFFRPIFYQGKLLFFTLARAHQEDTGGSFPGGYFPNGYDIHAEGMCIPPVKVFDKGVENKIAFEIIWNNVRFPEGVRLDNYSMIAATTQCEQRMTALLDKYGAETVLACVEEMMERTERAVRAEIEKMPDGTYYGEAATDDDGTDLDVPVWIRCDLTIRGGKMIVDLSKSDAQRKGFVNSVYAATYANAVGAAVLAFDPSLGRYHNEGTLRCIEVIAPEGLVVACRYPATVGASPVNVGIQVMEAIVMALSKARPDRAIAAWGKHRGDYVFGVDHRTQDRYVRTAFDYDGSGGATYGHDGLSGISTLGALGAVTRGNVEEMEIRIPHRMQKYEFISDLEGAGRWRGGPGIHWEAVNEGSPAGMATGSSDGDEMLGHGALGGDPSPACRTYIVQGEERTRIKPHRMAQWPTGASVLKLSSGGGGVGLPSEREPEQVRDDVVKEFVSVKRAREVYRVALDPVSLDIDWKETKALRSQAS